MGEKILVGMSGGVDSAVAALLLMKQGYQAVSYTHLITGARSWILSGKIVGVEP